MKIPTLLKTLSGMVEVRFVEEDGWEHVYAFEEEQWMGLIERIRVLGDGEIPTQAPEPIQEAHEPIHG